MSQHGQKGSSSLIAEFADRSCLRGCAAAARLWSDCVQTLPPYGEAPLPDRASPRKTVPDPNQLQSTIDFPAAITPGEVRRELGGRIPWNVD